MAKSGKRTASISGKNNPPKSKRIKKKRDDRAASKSTNKFGKEIVYTYRVGIDGRFLCAEFVKQNGDGGYTHPVHKLAMQDIHTFTEMDDGCWDMNYNKHPVKRLNHIDNAVDPQNTKNRYGKTCIVSYPNLEKFPVIDISVEEQFRNFVVKVYCETERCREEDRFVQWDPNRHSLTKLPYPSLDHVFVDSSVGTIVTEYFLPDYNMTREEKYKYLSDNDMLDVFTVKESGQHSGQYSFYAVETFGYPK